MMRDTNSSIARYGTAPVLMLGHGTFSSWSPPVFLGRLPRKRDQTRAAPIACTARCRPMSRIREKAAGICPVPSRPVGMRCARVKATGSRILCVYILFPIELKPEPTARKIGGRPWVALCLMPAAPYLALPATHRQVGLVPACCTTQNEDALSNTGRPDGDTAVNKS